MNKSTLAKISGILSVMIVAFTMTANAQQVTVADGVITYDGNKAFDNSVASSIENLNLTSEQRAAVTQLVVKGNFVSDNAFNNANDWGIESIDLSEAVLPEWYSFKNLTHLNNVVWPTTGSFIIPDGAFQTNSSEWTSVSIPTNCTEIKANAFTNHVLETVTIAGPSTIIRAQAFNNVKTVKNVYVLSGEETYTGKDWSGKECTMYYCEKAAFDYDVTWVQTQIDRVADAATLHIPSDAKNLDNFRIPNVDVLTQAVLCSTYHESSLNGWHEFIKNTEAIVAQDQVFRTFSDTKEHLFPKCTDINQGVKVYYIVGTTQINGVDKILIEPLNETADYLLPANTGVLVYTKKGVVIYNTEKNSGAQKVAQYAATTPKGNTNYLESLQDAPDEYYLSWSSTRRGKKCINMFLNNKRDVDPSPREWGFYTIIPQVYTKDVIGYHAYLNMPTDIMDSTSMYGFYDGNGDVPPSLSKVFNLDIDDLDGETTMIVNTKIDNDQTTSDNSYYNISGQKINEPANGLYIHAGKKYMK